MKECTFSVRWRVQMYCNGSASGEFLSNMKGFVFLCVGTYLIEIWVISKVLLPVLHKHCSIGPDNKGGAQLHAVAPEVAVCDIARLLECGGHAAVCEQHCHASQKPEVL